jgi:hypothetical protein
MPEVFNNFPASVAKHRELGPSLYRIDVG